MREILSQDGARMQFTRQCKAQRTLVTISLRVHFRDLKHCGASKGLQ